MEPPKFVAPAGYPESGTTIPSRWSGEENGDVASDVVIDRSQDGEFVDRETIPDGDLIRPISRPAAALRDVPLSELIHDYERHSNGCIGVSAAGSQ